MNQIPNPDKDNCPAGYTPPDDLESRGSHHYPFTKNSGRYFYKYPVPVRFPSEERINVARSIAQKLPIRLAPNEEKTMYKFSYRIAICAVLILISSISIFSQRRYDPKVPQVVEGCSERVTDIPETPPHYVYDDPNIPILRQVDKVETGFSRFTFTFRPNQVRIEQKQLLKFTLYPYGQELGNVNDLFVVRHSGVPAEKGAVLNWDQSRFASVKASGTWYAIFNSAGEYLQPVDTNKSDVDSMRNPVTHFSYHGNPAIPGAGNAMPSRVRPLTPGLELDTSNIAPGTYWVTLQGEADFGNQKCQKTTPPVLIQVVEPTRPRLNVTASANAKDCEYVTADGYDKPTPGYVTATAKLDYEYLKREDITLSWEIKDPKGKTLNDNDYVKSDNGMTVTVNKDLQEGKYTFTATASADAHGYKLEEKDTGDAIYNDCRLRSGSAAGIVYFQFAIPFPEEKRKPFDSRDPESWTGGDPRLRENPANPSSMPYPEGHFLMFFEKTNSERPSEDMTRSNTRMLDQISDSLEKYPTYRLKIYGYADYKKRRGYDNDALGWRRVNAVIDYLADKYAETHPGSDVEQFKKDRLIGGVVLIKESLGDTKARTCDPYNWLEKRRWDRRTEILYLAPGDDVSPPDYGMNPCPPYIEDPPTPVRMPRRKPGRRR